jgi:hypothetical protein
MFRGDQLDAERKAAAGEVSEELRNVPKSKRIRAQRVESVIKDLALLYPKERRDSLTREGSPLTHACCSQPAAVSLINQSARISDSARGVRY